MARERIVPLIFLAAFAGVMAQVLSVFLPPFFSLLIDPAAPGQVIRLALFWIGAHILAPVAGGAAGVWIAYGIGKKMKADAGE